MSNKYIKKVNDVSELINSVPIDNYEMVMDISAIIVKNFCSAENSIIFLSHEVNNKYEFEMASHSFPKTEITDTELFEPHPVFGDVLRNEDPMIWQNDNLINGMSYMGKRLLLSPLIANGVPFGILVACDPGDDIAAEENKYFLEIILTLISNLIFNAILFRKKDNLIKKVNKKNRELLESQYNLTELNTCLVSMLEDASLFRDHETGMHILRVRKYSKLLASKLGLNDEMVGKIELYSGLHDIGKLGVRLDILNKPGQYEIDEFEEMKKHPHLGYKIINKGGVDTVAQNIVLYHHEKFNGKGYPNEISGNDIPIEARIVALADVYDALTIERSYKDAFSDEKAESIIKKERGEHFDPELVDVFFDNIGEFRKIKTELTDN